MDLNIPRPEPGTATPCQLSRLWDFRQPQQISIESTRLFFLPCRHGNLHVVNGKDHCDSMG
jgi:hypothetical protein